MKTNRIMDHRTIPISTNENIHIFQRKLKLFYELGGKRNWAEVYCGDLIFFLELQALFQIVYAYLFKNLIRLKQFAKYVAPFWY